MPAGGVQFIDFEYGCYSYRGFDWGNHFNEYAGFECDYGRYPDAATASLFLRHYLSEAMGREPVRWALNPTPGLKPYAGLRSHYGRRNLCLCPGSCVPGLFRVASMFLCLPLAIMDALCKCVCQSRYWLRLPP